MTIQELINTLQEKLDKYGNRDVEIVNMYYEYETYELMSILHNGEKGLKFYINKN